MSSYDKIVKLACKPKAAPPKQKYLEPIIAATWSEDGAVHDVCNALSSRFREPNAIIVFKALIVLHHMIRNGATDSVLGYLSSQEVLRLRNVSSGNWEGYHAPTNLQRYAAYMDSRVRCYRELKHDPVRVQSETNRDIRASAALDDGDLRRSSLSKSTASANGGNLSRSKTLAGRKLRVMSVEKGLLRETKAVQRTIDALIECRFYLDDLSDELTLTALQMLVKDLLVLFQACNEGVINVLEHYFEMSRIDAEEALRIYRRFCNQTETVVEYFGVARKLQNLLNIDIPNLKHAPVSLAGALEEYLNDPNFEQNRIEYKANKEAAERADKTKTRTVKPSDKASTPKPATDETPTPRASTSGTSSGSTTAPANANPSLVDFFAAIEQEQPTMFNPQTESPSTTYFQQQAVHNPFTQRQMTGAFMGAPNAFGMMPQQTGFMVPQQTSTFPGAGMNGQMGGHNPFNASLQQLVQPPMPQQQLPQHPPFSSFMQPQPTGFPAPQQQSTLLPQQTGFLAPLQSQATGANPFRQSTLFPQMTGMPTMGNGTTNPFPQPLMGSSLSAGASPLFPQQQSQQPGSPTFKPPARPASTPLKTSSSPPMMQPVKTHQTGSRNPFGPIMEPVPPVPKPPTLFDLQQNTSARPNGQNGILLQTQQTGILGTPNAQGAAAGQAPSASSYMSDIASAFTFNKSVEGASGAAGTSGNAGGLSLLGQSGTTGAAAGSGLSFLNPQNTAATGSTATNSLFSQPTGATITSTTSTTPSLGGLSTLKPQTTGFTGFKPFKPTSSFGASLLESLPTIPQSTTTTPAAENPSSPPPQTGPGSGVGSLATSTPTGFGIGALNTQPTGIGALNAQPTGAFGAGSTVGVGLRPQMTGSAGAANPFRASVATSNLTGFGPMPPMPTGAAALTSSFNSALSGAGGNASSFQSTLPQSTLGTAGMGMGMFGGLNGQEHPQQQQQQQQNASLI